MFCYCYDANNAITLNPYEVIPPRMCNLGIVEIRGEITYLEERLLIQKPRDHTSM
jgi:hypothetical protein